MSPTDSQHPQPLTFLGIGNLGLAAVLALRQNHHPVTVWNRTPTRPQVQTATAAGAVLETSLPSTIARNDLIFLCVLDYSALFSALGPLPSEVFKGKTIINLTNGTPKQAARADVWFRERGVKMYIDGAVMVPPSLVGPAHGLVVASGVDQAAFGEVESVLSALGTTQYLGEDVTAAARFDLAALAAMYGMFAGGFVGMGLLKRASLSSTPFAKGGAPSEGTVAVGGVGDAGPKIGPTVKNHVTPILTSLVPYLGIIAEAWDEGRWDDNMGSPIGMQLQGMQNIVAGCEEEGVDPGFLRGFAGVLEKVVGRYGEDAGLAGVGPMLFMSAQTKKE